MALEHGAIFSAIPLYVAEPHLDGGARELDVRRLADDYDEGISAVDAALGAFVDELEARDVLERAYLVVSADHGESMIEHESFFDHNLLHSAVLDVPLIVRPPGGRPGARVAADVQLVDLYPTLCDLAGLTPGAVHGRSLAAVVRSPSVSLPSVPTYASGDFQASRALVMDGWKLVETAPDVANSGLAGYLTSPRVRDWLGRRFPDFRDRVFGTAELPPRSLEGVDVRALWEDAHGELEGPFHELYDVRADPGERVDLAGEQPRRVAALLELMDAATSAARSAFLADDGELPGLDAEQLGELERLGYGGKD